MSGSLGTLDFPRLDIAPESNPLQAYVDQASHLHGFVDRLGDQPQVAPAQPVVAGPTLAQGVSAGAGSLGDYIAAQRADAARRGLWNDEAGLPTGAGVVDAGRQYASGILMGSTAPGAKAVPGQLSLFDRPPEPVPLPEPAPAPPANVLTAYHGTPHLFEPTPDNPLGAFRDQAIGSGEGAQAFGHGHYLAENEGTARQYRDALSAGPTFDLTGTGGPEGRFGVAQTKDLLTGFLEDHPMLEDHPLEAVERGTHWAVEGVAEGKPIDQLHREADEGGWSQYHKDAAHSALEFLSDAKVDLGKPTVGGKPYDPLNPSHKAAQILDAHKGDTQAALGEIDQDLASARAQMPSMPSRSSAHYADTVQRLTEMRGMIADGSVGKYKAPGHMLETQIAGSPEEFLHWDRPLSQQSPLVQEALGKAGLRPTPEPDVEWHVDPDTGMHTLMHNGEDTGIGLGPAPNKPGYFRQYDNGKPSGGAMPNSLLEQWKAQHAETVASWDREDDPHGSELYHRLAANKAGQERASFFANDGDPAAASQALADAGVKGIRYLDAGSRNTFGGEHLSTEQTPQGWVAKIRLNGPNGQNAFTTSKPFYTKGAADQWAADKVQQPTHNYVVFSPRNIRIIRRYGIAGLTGGGAAAMAAQGQSAQQ